MLKEELKKKVHAITSDKVILALFIAVLVLGVTARLMRYDQVGYWNDDQTTLPTGLLWFYDAGYYPGLAGQGEPAFGNLIIAAGCMLSGEDFSRVREIVPMFYPGRTELIGQQLANAEPYCKAPGHLFGILFFFIMILFGIILFEKYGALYFAAFFAFNPFLLRYSRWIHVDIISYTFIAAGLLFLWLAYSLDKFDKKELKYSITAFAFFGLAFATKLPAGLFMAFGMFMLAEKYIDECLALLKVICIKLGLDEIVTKIKEKPVQLYEFVKLVLISGVSFILFTLLPVKLNPKNLLAVFQKYKTVGGSHLSGFAFNKELFHDLTLFFLDITAFDLLLFIVAIFFIVRVFLKSKNKIEKFIFYFFLLMVFTLLFVQSAELVRVFFPFAISFVFVAAFLFETNGLLKTLTKKRALVVLLLVIYIASAAFFALKTAPYYEEMNGILCHINKERCETEELSVLIGSSHKTMTLYMLKNLGENETFITGAFTPYFYLEHYMTALYWDHIMAFQNQIGRRPTILELKQYGQFPKNLRYYIEVKVVADPEIARLYDPIDTLQIRGRDVISVYDLDKPKNSSQA